MRGGKSKRENPEDVAATLAEAGPGLGLHPHNGRYRVSKEDTPEMIS